MFDMDDPPPVIAAVRGAVEVASADRDDVRLTHGIHDGEIGSPTWNTAVEPRGPGLPVVFWIDGFDEDLTLFVAEEYHLEWRDLSDPIRVGAEVAAICTAVVEGRGVIRREGRRRVLDLYASTGVRTAVGNHDSLLPWRGGGPDGPMPAYGIGFQVESACRVCGFDEDDERWTAPDVPLYVICSCCGAESGVEDLDLDAVRLHRERWRAGGRRWFEARRRPDGWQLADQERGIPFGWR